MKSVLPAQMREIDRRTIAEHCPGAELMERAGLGVARAVESLAAHVPCRPRVALFAGSGNNGGDAFACARHLAGSGFACSVWLTVDEAALKGDAAIHYRRMREAGVPAAACCDATVRDALGYPPSAPLIVVDGVLGTGLTGPARGAAALAIRAVNALGDAGRVVAIDVPSGLNSDTGEPLGETVRADLTVTMAWPKRGLLMPVALEFVGNLRVVDIGIPAALAETIESDVHLITPADFASVLRRRPRAAHKGTQGHVLIVGGSPGLTGAVSLAARAALRSGAGLVSVLTPEPLAPLVAAQAPEAMVHGAVCGEDGRLAVDAIERWGRNLAEFNAILIGPGLSLTRGTQVLCERLLAGNRPPLIVDADALNAFAHRMFLIKRAAGPVILTPHPGEMGRLLGISTAEVQADRLGAAARAAAGAHAVVALKGAGTIVARPETPPSVNLTGNPGMATGGMGDALAGLAAGLTASGATPWDAARAAVYLHGLAGDLAALAGAEASLTAGDLIEALPAAWRQAAVEGGFRW